MAVSKPDSGFDFQKFSIALEDAAETGVSFEGRGLKWETEEIAEELIKEIDACKDLKYLNLAGNTLGVKAAKLIGDALRKHPEFKKALWKDLFTGRLKTEIPQALQHLGAGIIAANAHLTVLDCSDNALGPNGMIGLVGLLKSRSCYTLQELKLNNCGLGIGGGKMLAQALLDCHKASTEAGTPLALKVFIAGRNRLENEGAKSLAKVFAALKSLEEIAMPQNGIYHDGINALSEAFKLNENMRVLNLNDNTITAKGAAYLADAFFSMQRLREINFGDCLLRTKGSILLADALQDDHTELVILNLGFNEIGIDGGLAVATALHNKTNLTSLILDGNQFGHEGRERIKEQLREYCVTDALGSLSEDDSEGEDEDDVDQDDDDEEDDDAEDEEDEETDDVDSEADQYHGESEEEAENVNYVTALSNKSLNTTVENTLDVSNNSSVYFAGEDSRPNTVETFCNTPNPTMKMFEDLEEKNKFEAFRTHLKNYSEDDYLVALVYTILKCSALAEESSEALDIAVNLYKDVFEYAKSTNQITNIKNFFLIQLGLLKCEEKNFKPAYNLKSCQFAIREAIKNNSIPDDVKTTFQLFLDRLV